MAFDALNFFQDFGVRYVTEGTKHCQPSWIQTVCPFCAGNPGWHLGYSENGDFFNCWRCGFHTNKEVIRSLAGVGWEKAHDIWKEYQTHRKVTKRSRDYNHAQSIKLPTGSDTLSPRHKRYLESRGFDPYHIMSEWDVFGTGPVGKYKHRIIAPIYYNERLVSYQGRDITNKSNLKYKACKIKNEVIHHKHILYGLDKVEGQKCILVEGITDAWRLGPGAVAGFGISMKSSQLLILTERFRKVFVMFDDDPQAIKASETIAHDLAMAGINCEICLIEGDPGSLPQKEADQIAKSLIG